MAAPHPLWVAIQALEDKVEQLQQARRVKVIPLEQATEPIVGWRVWRVFAIDELKGGATSYRLSSIGRMCNEKLWKPGKAKEASCSDFNTNHEAPWPDCGCGIWAVRSREQAEAVVAQYAPPNGSPGVVAWALGRVSLWGRVVECEKGYRAQFAYPYDLTVYADGGELERALRDLYVVDVAAAPLPVIAQKNEDEPAEEEPQPEEPQQASEPPVEFGPISDEDVLAGLVTTIAMRVWREDGPESSCLATTTAFVVAGAIYAARGHKNNCHLPEVDCAVDETLERFREQGLVEDGLSRAYAQGRSWRLTAAGRRHARSALEPGRVLVFPYWGEGHEVAVAEALRMLERAPRVFFADEIADERAASAPKRLEAKCKGRAFYREWLEQRRRTVRGRVGLTYSDEEVVGAVREASQLSRRRGRGSPVGFYAVMDRLAPGDYVTEERCPVAYKLSWLVKTGMLVRASLNNGKPAWEVAAKG